MSIQSAAGIDWYNQPTGRFTVGYYSNPKHAFSVWSRLECRYQNGGGLVLSAPKNKNGGKFLRYGAAADGLVSVSNSTSFRIVDRTEPDVTYMSYLNKSDSLDIVNALRPRVTKIDNENVVTFEKQHISSTAYSVLKTDDDTPDEVSVGNSIAILVSAIQKLSERIENLERRL